MILLIYANLYRREKEREREREIILPRTKLKK